MHDDYSFASPIEKVLAHFPNAQKRGDEWIDCCPAHDDSRPSLSIKAADDGTVLLTCRSNGCSAKSIVTAKGLQMKDLFPRPPNSPAQAAPKLASVKRTIPDKPTRPTFPTSHDAIESLEARHGERSAEWTYQDASGEPIGMVLRWNLGDGKKDFRPLTRRDDRWAVEGMPEPRPLYRLPELQGADRVFVCEGEKAADAIRLIELTATTSAGGSQAPSKTDWSPLAGKIVVVLPDNDEPGRKYADWVVRHLLTLRPVPTIKIVTLPNLPNKGDAVDWIDSSAAQTMDELRETLLNMTLEAPVISAPPLEPNNQASSERTEDSQPGLLTVNLADVEPKEVTWLWGSRIPLGKITLIGGDPGLGKSTMTMDIAARVTRGDGWPDDRDYRAPPAKVLLFNSEDDIADTIRPRLDTAGAIVENVIVTQGVPALDHDGNPSVRGFDLSRDLPRLTHELEKHADIRLVIIDPISAYCGKVDSHNNTDVRGMLAPLAELAAKYSVAMILVTHLSKGASGRAVYRAMGSLAFAAAARAVWAVDKDPDDPERRLWVPVKFNCGPMPTGLAYRSTGRIVWDDKPVLQTADELLCGDGASPRNTQEAPASQWLREFLQDGPQDAVEVLTQAELCGFSRGQINKAKGKLKVISARTGFDNGKWEWSLTFPRAHDNQTGGDK